MVRECVASDNRNDKKNHTHPHPHNEKKERKKGRKEMVKKNKNKTETVDGDWALLAASKPKDALHPLPLAPPPTLPLKENHRTTANTKPDTNP